MAILLSQASLSLIESSNRDNLLATIFSGKPGVRPLRNDFTNAAITARGSLRLPATKTREFADSPRGRGSIPKRETRLAGRTLVRRQGLLACYGGAVLLAGAHGSSRARLPR
jgi:hypothetical protein